MEQALQKRTLRLETRVTPEEKEMIYTAARIMGTTMANFVVMAAKEAAQRSIRLNATLTLSLQGQQRFYAELQDRKVKSQAIAAARELETQVE